MQKELLLAIGDDRAASYNLRFLNEIFDNFCDLKLTLFYVAPLKATWEMDKDKLVPRGKGFDEMVAHAQSKGVKALDDAMQWIHEIVGCSGTNVETKVIHSPKGTVQTLVDEARNGMYDALVLGRKAFTWFEEVFENSVCHEILWQNIDFPIWVCRKPPSAPRHDVLLCLDGSDACMRMVDHAGYMLANEKEHTFTLFHVAESLRGPGTDELFDKGLKLLAENGIGEDRIELKVVKARSTVKATIKEAMDGNYSAVGVGRHNEMEPSRMQTMFPSSVTVRLLRQMTSSALWISK